MQQKVLGFWGYILVADGYCVCIQPFKCEIWMFPLLCRWSQTWRSSWQHWLRRMQSLTVRTSTCPSSWMKPLMREKIDCSSARMWTGCVGRWLTVKCTLTTRNRCWLLMMVYSPKMQMGLWTLNKNRNLVTRKHTEPLLLAQRDVLIRFKRLVESLVRVSPGTGWGFRGRLHRPLTCHHIQ